MRKRKKWLVDAIEEFQIDADFKDGVEFAKLLKDALERPSEYILTSEQCKALLSLIASGKKHVVSKTSDNGDVVDIALRPSLFLRLKALEMLCNDKQQDSVSLPIFIEVYPVNSIKDVQDLKTAKEKEDNDQS